MIRPKLYLIESKPFHVDLMEMPPEHESVYESFGFKDAKTHVKALITDADKAAWTVIDEEANVIGICGAISMTKGVARVWFTIDKKVLEDRRLLASFMGSMEWAMNDIGRQWDLHRIEAIVREDFEEGISTAMHRRFKFNYEGLMKFYDTDLMSYHLYARYCAFE